MSYQNGYPGQQQYGGYPPPPPSRSKTPLIVFSVFVVLIVLGAGIFVVSRFSGSGGSPDGGSAKGPQQPDSSRTTDRPSYRPTSAPTEESCYKCFPGVKVTTLESALRAKGFACKTDQQGGECWKEGGLHTVRFYRSIGNQELIHSVVLHMFGRGPGKYPQGAGEALTRMRADLPIVLAVLFPDQTIRAKLTGWFQQNLAGPEKKATLDGYEFLCQAPSPVSVADKSGLVTAWGSYVKIDGKDVDE